MTDDTPHLGDAQGEWYYCLKDNRVEMGDECAQKDRMGPYPTREAAENWRTLVAERNEEWDNDDAS